MKYKLGKREAQHDSRDLTFAALKRAASTPLPKPPVIFGHGRAFADWLMLGNDRYGDCVFAGAAHETMITTKLGGNPARFNTRAVLADYSIVTGFDPSDPSTDQGAYTRDALRYRQRTGIQDADGGLHRIGAYVALTPGDFHELMEATYCFTCVGLGIQFPDTAMDQYDNDEPWDVVPGAQIEGGHYVPCVGRQKVGVASVITWGKRQAVTRRFVETYTDEAWGMIYPEEIRDGKTERGFDLTQLNELLRELTG